MTQNKQPSQFTKRMSPFSQFQSLTANSLAAPNNMNHQPPAAFTASYWISGTLSSDTLTGELLPKAYHRLKKLFLQTFFSVLCIYLTLTGGSINIQLPNKTGKVSSVVSLSCRPSMTDESSPCLQSPPTKKKRSAGEKRRRTRSNKSCRCRK